MSMFRDRRGIERWTCFATGASGTAVDLVMVATGRDAREAFEWLASRANLGPASHPLPMRPPGRDQGPPPSVPPSDALRRYITACAATLWEPAGAATRQWLVGTRQLNPEVLRTNLVGADPGRRTMPRARGLPWRGPAAVFPALDESRQPVYLQARYLHPAPGRTKYDNPTAEHGANPRVSLVEAASDVQARDVVLVTEGMPDALTAATAGYLAAAVLGAGLPDARVADRLARADKVLVLAFDADDAGRAGAARLASLLHERHARVVDLCPPVNDLNEWARATGPAFPGSLARAIDLAACARPRAPVVRGVG